MGDRPELHVLRHGVDPALVGLENYGSLVTDPVFRVTLVNTLVYVIGSTVLITVDGLALALAINTAVPGARHCMTAMFLTNLMPIIAVCLVWRFLLHPFGLVNQLLSPFGFDRIDWLTNSDTAMPAIIAVTVWRFAPYFMIVFLAGLLAIPDEYYEAADLDGAGPLRRFRHITLPQLSPIIFFVVVVSGLLCARIFLMPYIITAVVPATRPACSPCWSTKPASRTSRWVAPRRSRWCCSPSCWSSPSSRCASSRAARRMCDRRRRARSWQRWVGFALLAGLSLLFVLPILWMVSTSFQAGEKMFQLTTEWIPSEWHPENYPNALSRAAFGQYFLNSGIVSIAVMVGNIVFCTLAGYGLAKFRFRGDRFVLLAILSTLMLPLEVTLVPTFLVVHYFGWLNTYQGIIGPLLIDAFGVFLMRQSIISIPSDYIEAARMDGASELRILWQIIVPQCMPALAMLAIFSFRDSWDQYLWPLTIVSVDECGHIRSASFSSARIMAIRRPSRWRSPFWRRFPFSYCSGSCSAVNRGFGLSGLK